MQADYLKIYGQMRTGTNYLQALMLYNYPKTGFLTNTLGSKHDSPINWKHWLHRNRVNVTVPKAIHDARANNRIGCLVAIKDPYGSVFSYINYIADKPKYRPGNVENYVHDYCLLYNATYKAWTTMDHPWLLVNYETMLNECYLMLKLIGDRYELNPPEQYVDVPFRLEEGERISNEPHDREFWKDRRYLDTLDDWTIKRITELIDWDIIGPLGYSPE